MFAALFMLGLSLASGLLLGGSPIVTGLLAYVAYRSAMRHVGEKISAMTSFGMAEAQPSNETSKRYRTVNKGSLPMSVRVRGKAYRFHSRKYFFEDASFHLNFVDDERKLYRRERFAGPGMNTGHYFAFSAKNAAEERGHYGAFRETHGLLVVEGEMDKILDLTSAYFLDEVRKEVVPELPRTFFLYNLVSTPSGGTDTSFMTGQYAVKKQYNGILFYSARTLETGAREWMESPGSDFAKYWGIEAMSLNVFQKCLVAFSGALLVSSIRKYSFDSKGFKINPYFGRNPEEILALQRSATAKQGA